MGRLFTFDRNITPVKQENAHFTGQAGNRSYFRWVKVWGKVQRIYPIGIIIISTDDKLKCERYL